MTTEAKHDYSHSGFLGILAGFIESYGNPLNAQRQREIADIYDELVAMLEELEFSSIDGVTGAVDCPICGGSAVHTATCKLATVLAKAQIGT